MLPLDITITKLSIHPSIFCHCSSGVSWWQQAKHFSHTQLLPEDPEASTHSDEMQNLSRIFWVYPELSYQLDVHRKPPKEVPRRHIDQIHKPSKLAPFNMKEQLPLESELLSKGEPSHPRGGTYFGHLYPRYHSFSHYSNSQP